MKEAIFLASDHAGFKLKERVKFDLEKKSYQIEDFGPKKLNKEDDYPDFIIPAVEKAIKTNSIVIVFGGSGQGEAIAANKVKGARAVVIYNSNRKIMQMH